MAAEVSYIEKRKSILREFGELLEAAEERKMYGVVAIEVRLENGQPVRQEIVDRESKLLK